jgi:hypothetical protein
MESTSSTADNRARDMTIALKWRRLRKILEAKLERGEECKVCLDRPTAENACILRCLHYWCRNCIEQMNPNAELSSPTRNVYTCPLCRRQFQSFYMKDDMTNIYSVSRYSLNNSDDSISLDEDLQFRETRDGDIIVTNATVGPVERTQSPNRPRSNAPAVQSPTQIPPVLWPFGPDQMGLPSGSTPSTSTSQQSSASSASQPPPLTPARLQYRNNIRSSRLPPHPGRRVSIEPNFFPFGPTEIHPQTTPRPTSLSPSPSPSPGPTPIHPLLSGRVDITHTFDPSRPIPVFETPASLNAPAPTPGPSSSRATPAPPHIPPSQHPIGPAYQLYSPQSPISHAVDNLQLPFGSLSRLSQPQQESGPSWTRRPPPQNNAGQGSTQYVMRRGAWDGGDARNAWWNAGNGGAWGNNGNRR